MATNNPRGFVPTRNLVGDNNFSFGPLRPLKGKNIAQIMAGDVAHLDASGNVQRYPNNGGGQTAASQLPLGVVANIFDANRRPLTFNQPGVGGPLAPVSSNYFVQLYENPYIIYTANCSSTAAYGNVGEFAQIRVTAGNTAAGRSGMGVDLVAAGNSAVGYSMKIIGVSPADGLLDEAGVSGAANNDVEVMFVNHVWTNPYQRLFVGSPGSAT